MVHLFFYNKKQTNRNIIDVLGTVNRKLENFVHILIFGWLGFHLTRQLKNITTNSVIYFFFNYMSKIKAKIEASLNSFTNTWEF